MKFFPAALAAACLCFFAACVSIENNPLPSSDSVANPYSDLNPGYTTNETAHFFVKAYSSETAAKYSRLCERYYFKIMGDTGLYSFVPAKPYNIVVYKNLKEYVSKTGQPEWSGGMTYGNAILIYESESARGVLAHEITHLIFNEFMGSREIENLRWLNEGLAVYEEKNASSKSRVFYENKFSELVSRNPIPFSQMESMAPLENKGILVEKWYAQVASIVSFMIREEGSFSFSIFLKRLKDGVRMNEALKEGFKGKWQSLKDLEKSWLGGL